MGDSGSGVVDLMEAGQVSESGALAALSGIAPIHMSAQGMFQGRSGGE